MRGEAGIGHNGAIGEWKITYGGGVLRMIRRCCCCGCCWCRRHRRCCWHCRSHWRCCCHRRCCTCPCKCTRPPSCSLIGRLVHSPFVRSPLLAPALLLLLWLRLRLQQLLLLLPPCLRLPFLSLAPSFVCVRPLWYQYL